MILPLLDVLRSDVVDERTHCTDIVGEAHHTEDLDDDQANGFLVGGG